jgi:Protein of unknown function (DUF1573)
MKTKTFKPFLAQSVLFACLVLVAGFGAEDSASAASEGPSVAFSETEFNFGKVAVGQVVQHTFYLTNLEDKPLEVINARSGGGPLVRDWDKVIEPRQAGRVLVTLKMPQITGTMLRAVTVTFGGASNAFKSMLIRATRWGPIDWEPASTTFSAFDGEWGEQTKTVRIFNRTSQPLILQAPVCTNQSVRAELRTVDPGREFELAISYSNSPSSIASLSSATIPFYGQVQMSTSDTSMPLLLTLFSISRPRLFVFPPSVELEKRGERFYDCSFSIHSQGRMAWEVSDVSVNSETLSLTATKGADGQFYSVHARFANSVALHADPAFTVKTTHPGMPIITVPIIAKERQ